jgi:hypothetical protein
MKITLYTLICFLILPLRHKAQDTLTAGLNRFDSFYGSENSGEQNEDALAEQNERLHYYTKHPINLNQDNLDDLSALLLLTPLQIDALKRYKKNAGPLISVYEMQSIPGWDIRLINNIKPFVAVGSLRSLPYAGQNSSSISQQFSIRTIYALERARGYSAWDDVNRQNIYPGSPLGLMLKYHFQWGKNFGFTTSLEKDPGEKIFNNNNRGFDFSTANLWLRDVKKIKLLVLGDYTANIAQGLICWQGFSFGGTFEPAMFKKSGDVINRYRSTAEFGFNRGLAISLNAKKIQQHFWLSGRQMDARTVLDFDSVSKAITSFQTTGLHRTFSENSNKNNATVFQTGYVLQWHQSNVNIGLNFHRVAFEKSKTAGVKLYERFETRLKHLSNTSIDGGLNLFNIHWFGEWALDDKLRSAVLIGAIGSISKQADLAISFKHIPLGFQSPSVNGWNQYFSIRASNSFTALMNLLLFKSAKLSVYLEQNKYPWPTYNKNASALFAGWGFRFALQKNKREELMVQYKKNTDLSNIQNEVIAIKTLGLEIKNQLDIQHRFAVSDVLWVVNQLNLVSFKQNGNNPAQGFSINSHVQFNKVKPSWNLQASFRYFHTDDFASAIYFRETAVNSTSAGLLAYGKGYRFSALLHFKWSKSIELDIKLSRVVYYGVHDFGQGWDEIAGNKRTTAVTMIRLKL